MHNKQKKVNFSIDDGKMFYADEVAIIHNPMKLFIDFKNTSPRVDIRFNEFQPMVLQHNVIMMDPWTAKQLHKNLGENIKNYEDAFGKIKKPKQIEKSEKDHQKELDKIPKSSSTVIHPSYVG